MSNILVTGASGFVGRRLISRLIDLGHCLFAVVREAKSISENNYAVFKRIGEINGKTDWADLLSNQEVVIHTAARAHVMNDTSSDPIAAYREVNVAGTLNLAQQCVNAGVQRFVFISSVKVNGERTAHGRPFYADDLPAPEDAYGVSKHEAEIGLLSLAEESGMEVVIIRPPLVYGPGVKGNFASMIRLVERGVPLPLGSIHNKRSLVALDNLVDLIITCIEHPKAANQIFLAGDGVDLSTTELLRGVAKAMGRPSRLIPIPSGLLTLAASVLGKKDVARRLMGSLQVDITKTCELLDWNPPISVEEGLRRCFITQK
jgi:nucleoside-diphosphate-sugar epimerase